MDLPDPDLPADLATRPLRTLCPHCMGMGVVNQPRLALYADSGATVGVPESCPHCNGDRWWPGLRPAV